MPRAHALSLQKKLRLIANETEVGKRQREVSLKRDNVKRKKVSNIITVRGTH